MDLSALSAWAAVLAVFAAIVALIVQVRQAAFNSSMASLWHLEERFGNIDMLKARVRAARFLLESSGSDAWDVAALRLARHGQATRAQVRRPRSAGPGWLLIRARSVSASLRSFTTTPATGLSSGCPPQTALAPATSPIPIPMTA